MSVIIAAVTHKEYKLPDDPLYMPLMVGSALMGEVPTEYIRDDSGDNISARNRSFCELTGLYWVWKNLDADHIGICHYRRYFAYKRHILCLNEAEKLAERADIILPKQRRYYIETNYTHYAHAHHAADLDTVRDIIRERYPDHLQAYDRRMRMRSGHRFNMLIMRRDILDRYCTWLFDILFELERRLDISDYSEKDRRVFGFVAERLLDVWLDAGHEEYIELPYVMTEKEYLSVKAMGMIIRKFRSLRRKKHEQ